MRQYHLIMIFILFLSISYGQKIKVLNVGTFHMAGTTDARKVEFDVNDKNRIEETNEIARMLAQFKPTVICVEVVPSENEGINLDYSKFITDPNHKANYKGEIELIAYQVGKLAGVKRIYGIDEQATASYNYFIWKELQDQVDSLTSINYMKAAFKDFDEVDELPSTISKIKLMNTKEYWEASINVNADILTHNATQGNFEGADEAAKFYRRNLRIYSNLNQIPLSENDRVFILMGATHTAFLNEFIKRSPKYELIDLTDYLK